MNKWTRIIAELALALLVSIAGLFVHAEDVRISLKNGDLLRGRLISEGDIVLIEHALLGEVRIPKSSVKNIVRPEKKEDEEMAQESSGIEASKAPESRMNGFVRAISFQAWTRQFEFGMNTQRGRRDKIDFNARLNMRRKIEKNDFRFETRRYFGKSDQVKTTDRIYSNFRWRRDLSPGVFYQSDTLYSTDAIKEIDLNLEQTFSLGYRFINQKELKISTGAGMSGRYRDDNTDQGNMNYLVDFFQDADYSLNSRLRLTQEFRIALPPNERSNFEYEFQTGIVSKVTDSLHLSIRYQLEYDKSLPEDRREDQRIVSSVGIDF